MELIPQVHRSKIIIGLIVVVGLVAAIWFKKALVSMIWPEDSQQVYQAAQPAKGMSDSPTEAVTIKTPLKTYNKEQALKKGAISPESAADPKKALLKTATIKPSEGTHTVSVVVDKESGETTIEEKENPRSWYAFGGSGSLGIRGGLSLPGGITGTIYVNQKLIRLSQYQLSGYAEINASELRPVEFKVLADMTVFQWN